MLPALVVFQYFLVQFAPATKGSERSQWTSLIHTDPHWHTATHCRARVRFSGSAASRARCPGPGTSCLLPAASCSRCCTSRLMLHRVASLRVCSEPISVSFAILLSLKSLKRIERRKGGRAVCDLAVSLAINH